MEKKSNKNIIAGVLLIVSFVLNIVGEVLLGRALFGYSLINMAVRYIPSCIFIISCFVKNKEVMPKVASALLILPVLMYCLGGYFQYGGIFWLQGFIDLVVFVLALVGSITSKKSNIVFMISAFLIPLIFLEPVVYIWWGTSIIRILLFLIEYAVLAIGFFFFAQWIGEDNVVMPQPVAYRPVYQQSVQPVYQQPVQPVYQQPAQPVYRPVQQVAPQQPTTVKVGGNDQLKSIEAVERLKGLLDSGAITQEEFDAKKKEILGL